MARNKTLTALAVLFVLSTLADGLFTFVNLRTIGFGFEANPIVKGVFTLVLVKLAVIVIGYYTFKTYYSLTFDARYLAILTLVALTFGQFLGAYSHLPLLIENAQASKITVTPTNYTVTHQDGTTSTYEPLQPKNRTWEYFRIIFWIMAYPMIFAQIIFAITRKTSTDIELKVK